MLTALAAAHAGLAVHWLAGAASVELAVLADTAMVGLGVEACALVGCVGLAALLAAAHVGPSLGLGRSDGAALAVADCSAVAAVCLVASSVLA